MEDLLCTKTVFNKRNFFNQYTASVSATLAMVCNGMHQGWSSPSLPLLLHKDSHIPITSAEGSWITVYFALGAPFGNILSLLLADKIGRKHCILLTSPIFLIAWLTIAYATSVVILSLGRFLGGVATGLAQATLPMYVGEISDKNRRGLLTAWIPISVKIGTLAINIIGVNYSIKTAAFISSILPLLHFIIFSFMPESPRFYILKGKDEKAANNLRKLTGNLNVHAEVTKLATFIRENTKSSKSVLNIFKSRANRKALGICWTLFSIQHFSGYFSITFYALTIFTEAGGPIQGSTATVILFLVQVLVVILSSPLLDVIGRRPLLITSALGCACALSITGTYFYVKDKTNIDITYLNFLPLMALILCIVSANIGLNIVPVVIMSEFFPVDVKAMAFCISNIYFNVIGAVITKLFQVAKDEYGMYSPFLMFAFFCTIGLIFIFYFIPETKGKTLEEVQVALQLTLDTKPRDTMPLTINKGY